MIRWFCVPWIFVSWIWAASAACETCAGVRAADLLKEKLLTAFAVAPLSLSGCSPVVGILAALRPEKNHELFLSGAARILAKHPATQFLVIGDGPRRGELETLAERLAIAPSVKFLGSRSDVPQLLSACDLVALTSHNEASPVSILEALSAGVPVVASNVGSVRETVAEGETGRLFPAGDLDAFVAAVVGLLDDGAARARFGAEGRRRVAQRWSLQAMVRGYEQLIETILAEKTTRRQECSSPSMPTRRWRLSPDSQ